MFYTIYKITNKINGKIYIGKHATTNVNDNYWGSGKLLKASIKKNGIDNFVKEILFIFNTEEEMNAKEAEIVTEEFCSLDTTYNLCPGGRGGFGYINSLIENQTHTSEHAKYMVTIREEKYANDQSLKKLHGYKVSEALKEKHLSNTIFNSNQRSLMKNLQSVGVEHSKLPNAIEKRKKTFSNICHQQGVKNSQFGSCWVTSAEGVTKKISRKELDYFIEMGYRHGRK